VAVLRQPAQRGVGHEGEVVRSGSPDTCAEFRLHNKISHAVTWQTGSSLRPDIQKQTSDRDLEVQKLILSTLPLGD